MTEVQITSDTSHNPHGSRASVILPTGPSNPGGRGRSCVPLEPRDRHDATKSQQHFTTVCSSDCRPRPSVDLRTRLRTAKSHASLKLKHLDPVKMAYLRTSFIFAFAVLVTWIPSSINRIYSLSHDGRVSFQLSVASGCVLPLQGVWNALIYFTTSWNTFNEEMQALWKTMRGRDDRSPARTDSRYQSPVEHRDTFERLRRPATEPVSSQQSDDDLELGNYGMSASQDLGGRH